MESKKCSKCKISKKFTEFYKDNNRKNKLSCWCKGCYNVYQEKNKLKRKLYQKQYREKFEERKKKLDKIYYERNKKRILKMANNYRKTHKKQRNQYLRQRKRKDSIFKILVNLRNRISMAIKDNSKSSATTKLLGCTIQYLKQYLESRFQSGMTWSNWSLKGWHIDHIKPCAKFNLSKAEEQRKCFHYSNLQPLWAIDNYKKGVKYEK